MSPLAGRPTGAAPQTDRPPFGGRWRAGDRRHPGEPRFPGLARLRTGHGPGNMATVRHMAVNLVREAHSTHSLKVRRKKAAWNNNYLETLLRRTA